MAENARSKRHSDIGTFVVRVMQHQNGTWQGKITWVDEDKSMNFRSVWELVKLIGSALDTVSDPDEPAEDIHWPE